MATDRGSPRLAGSATLTVIIVDLNDNSPTIPVPHEVRIPESKLTAVWTQYHCCNQWTEFPIFSGRQTMRHTVLKDWLNYQAFFSPKSSIVISCHWCCTMCPIMMGVVQQNLILLKGATTNGNKLISFYTGLSRLSVSLSRYFDWNCDHSGHREWCGLWACSLLFPSSGLWHSREVWNTPLWRGGVLDRPSGLWRENMVHADCQLLRHQATELRKSDRACGGCEW